MQYKVCSYLVLLCVVVCLKAIAMEQGMTQSAAEREFRFYFSELNIRNNVEQLKAIIQEINESEVLDDKIKEYLVGQYEMKIRDLGRSPEELKNKELFNKIVLAITKDDLDAAEDVYKKGFDINFVETNDQGDAWRTALSDAASRGSLDMVQLLIARGAQINPQTKLIQGTPLMGAIRRGNLEIVQYLINHGANIGDIDGNGLRALAFALKHNKTAIAEILKRKEEDLSFKLNRAILNKDLNLIKQLYSMGANLNYVRISFDGVAQNTPLSLAVYMQVPLIITYLVEHGAKINPGIPLKDGNPLEIAIRHSYNDIVRYLVEQGANIYDIDGRGKRALAFAIELGLTDLAKYFITIGANIQNADGLGHDADSLAQKYHNNELRKFIDQVMISHKIQAEQQRRKRD